MKPTMDVESFDNLRLLLDVMIDEDGKETIKKDLKMSLKMYGEIPILGEFIFVMIKDDKIMLID